MPTAPSSTEPLIAPATLKALSRRSSARGLAQLALHLGLLALSTLLLDWAGDRPVLLLPAMVLQGWLLLSLFAPLHETAHYTAFASRPLNLAVGWLCGLPALFNWHYYQRFHFAHHRHTQDPARDPELDPPAPRTRREYLLRLTGWQSWKGRATVMTRLALGGVDGFPFIPESARRAVVASARAQLAVTALVVAACLASGHGAALLQFWILPVLLAMPLLRAYLLTEHTGCSESADGLVNTRTTLTNGFVRATMWNMPFHAEHHLYPSIPFHALPAAHAAIATQLAVVGRGYGRVTRSLLAALPR